MHKRATGYIVAGVLIGPFLAVLDQTMVSVALPQIVAEVGGKAWYAWLKVSYLFFSTMATLIVGRLVEIMPRKPVVVGTFMVYTVGSVLCALTPVGKGDEVGFSVAFGWLLVARAVQGMGGGALFAVAFATLAWLFPPRTRSRWAGLVGAVFGIAATMGPPLGGLLTESLGWRWTFWINLPLGLAGLLLIGYALPNLPPAAKGKMDWSGAALLTLWTGSWLLSLSAFGTQKALSTHAGLVLFILGLISLWLWVQIQRRSESPLFDLSYFRIPSFRQAFMASFAFGPLFFGVITFSPLYLQKVLGQVPSVSGRYLLVLVLMSVVSTAWAGAWVSRHGRYKPLLLWGSVVLGGLLGVGAAFLPASCSEGVLVAILGGIGLAMGPMQALLGVIAQNDVPQARVGTITSAILFARQMGASWGLAALNTLYGYGLHQSAEVRVGIQAALTGMIFLAAALLLFVFLLPDQRLRHRHVEEEMAKL